jgi:eukaryotic-like serine/threonine-protein kinase
MSPRAPQAEHDDPRASPPLLSERYRLIERVGAGGMGTVWEAEDELLQRRVAVKILSDGLAGNEQALGRFEREAKAAARLSGPHIAAVYDFGRDRADTPYIVMELVEGETLAARLQREGPLSAPEAARIAADVADALEEAHREGIVHRDVKPGNIMLTREGEVRVMDFGIAAAAWAESNTTTGAVFGTASYLSPEQAAGERATPSSDVYALGAVLYEMLAGTPPFVRETPVATAIAHAHDEPEAIEQAARDVPPSVAAACSAALQKDPAARPQSAAAFAVMLRDLTARLPLPELAVTAPVALDASSTSVTTRIRPVAVAEVPEVPAVADRARPRYLLPVVLAALLLFVVIVSSQPWLSIKEVRHSLRTDLNVPTLGGTSPTPALEPSAAPSGSSSVLPGHDKGNNGKHNGNGNGNGNGND